MEHTQKGKIKEKHNLWNKQSIIIEEGDLHQNNLYYTNGSKDSLLLYKRKATKTMKRVQPHPTEIPSKNPSTPIQ